MASLRLIVAPGLTDGAYRTGLAITMASGAHTYWRSPGDAGVPPVARFSGSRNLASAEILFPPPSRIKEDGLEIFGYLGHVVVPLRVKPIDPDKPVLLRVNLAYAVCNKICVPVDSTVAAALPGTPSADEAARVEAAYATLPSPLPPDDQDALILLPDNPLAPDTRTSQKPSWTVTWRGTTPLRDLFIEAPEGYDFTTRAIGTPDSWTLVENQGPPTKNVVVTLTLAGEKRSFVTTRTLDVPPAKP